MPLHDEQVLLSWLPRLRRYARALVRHRDDADDLVQETLERAWAKSAHWSGVSDMRAWLFSLMHNLHVDRFRSSRLVTVEWGDEAGDTPVEPTHGARLEVLDLQTALAQLSAQQREVVLLVGLEAMTYTEVAQTLGIPVGTVMARLSRGRERLRALMDGGIQPARMKVVK